MKAKEAYMFVDDPLLQQILVQRDATIPTTTKIGDVTGNPMVDASLATKEQIMNSTLNQSSNQMNRGKFPIAEKLRCFKNSEIEERPEAYRRGRTIRSTKSWIVVKTSLDDPSSARLTPSLSHLQI